MSQLSIASGSATYSLPACVITSIDIESDGLSGFSIYDELGPIFNASEVSYAKEQSPLRVQISCPKGCTIVNTSHGSAMLVSYDEIKQEETVA